MNGSNHWSVECTGDLWLLKYDILHSAFRIWSRKRNAGTAVTKEEKKMTNNVEIDSGWHARLSSDGTGTDDWRGECTYNDVSTRAICYNCLFNTVSHYKVAAPIDSAMHAIGTDAQSSPVAQYDGIRLWYEPSVDHQYTVLDAATITADWPCGLQETLYAT